MIDRAACRQLVGKRNEKRLFHQLGIHRTGQRVVIILFFFNACCLEAKLMKVVPSRFISISPDNSKDCRAKIRSQRFWIREKSLKTFATIRDDFRVVELPERRNQARSEVRRRGGLLRFSFPANRIKGRERKSVV